MDTTWRLLVSIFFLMIAVLLIVFAIIFESGTLAVINLYGAMILGFIGVGKGSIAIYDHKQEKKNEEKE